MGDYGFVSDAERAVAEQAFDARCQRALAAGEHVWLALVGFTVDRPELDGPLVLDRRNVATGPMLGCYLCERPWSPAMRTRRCRP